MEKKEKIESTRTDKNYLQQGKNWVSNREKTTASLLADCALMHFHWPGFFKDCKKLLTTTELHRKNENKKRKRGWRLGEGGVDMKKQLGRWRAAVDRDGRLLLWRLGMQREDENFGSRLLIFASTSHYQLPALNLSMLFPAILPLAYSSLLPPDLCLCGPIE